MIVNAELIVVHFAVKVNRHCLCEFCISALKMMHSYLPQLFYLYVNVSSVVLMVLYTFRTVFYLNWHVMFMCILQILLVCMISYI